VYSSSPTVYPEAYLLSNAFIKKSLSVPSFCLADKSFNFSVSLSISSSVVYDGFK
jgi:hypothetical protein